MHTPAVTKPHNVDPSGTQKIYRFPNGFGASVVKFAHSYGGRSGRWELAVIEFKGDDIFNYRLTYSTPITDDVIGHLTPDAVEKLLDQIEALPAKKRSKAMTKEEKLAVFEAYLDDKTIQVKAKESDGDIGWLTTSSPLWNFTDCEYRVKPEEIPADKVTIDWKASFHAMEAANKTLQSAYNEMKGQRDALFNQLGYMTEQRDKAEEEADHLRGLLNSIRSTLDHQN